LTSEPGTYILIAGSLFWLLEFYAPGKYREAAKEVPSYLQGKETHNEFF
jgi:hypothetical protein